VLVLLCLVDGGAARVEITDRSPRPPILSQAEEDAESGRGLRIVERLSRRWGTDRLPGRGKTVWFEVERPRRPAKAPPGPDEAPLESPTLVSRLEAARLEMDQTHKTEEL
ncbi:MAG: ATP-binding protein, partial [Acidimicrobiia bacterium]